MSSIPNTPPPSQEPAPLSQAEIMAHYVLYDGIYTPLPSPIYIADDTDDPRRKAAAHLYATGVIELTPGDAHYVQHSALGKARIAVTLRDESAA